MSSELQDTNRDFASVNERILARNPRARAAWEDSQDALRLALMLVRQRKSKGLTQIELAERAGWDKSYVSRLERAGGGMPDLGTISRYLGACGATAGLVVASSDGSTRLHVDDAVALSAAVESENMFASLRDRDFDLGEDRVAALP